MKKNRILYLMVMVTVLLCGLWGGIRFVPVLLVLLILLPVISAVRLYLSAGGLSVSFDGEHSCYSGQSKKLAVKIGHTFLRPTGYMEITAYCENHIFGTETRDTYLLEPGRKASSLYEIDIDTSACGGQVIRIPEMVCYDLLRLVSCKVSCRDEFTCTVYPYEARMYAALSRQMEREQAGDIFDNKRSGSDVSEVFDLREYREGDYLQSIHWKLSWKMKQLIVREFGRPINYHTLILMSPSLFYGEKEVSMQVVNGVFDLGVSFSHALLNQNIAHFVGYLSGDEVQCVSVDSMQGYEDMRYRLMNHPIQKDGDTALLTFINQQMYRQYTKIVYAVGEINETAARSLATQADLTILQATEDYSGHFLDGDGYEVISISIADIRGKQHIISL